MKRFLTLRNLLAVCLLTVLGSAGIYVYLESELRKFESEIAGQLQLDFSPNTSPERGLIRQKTVSENFLTEDLPPEHLNAPPIETITQGLETEEPELEILDDPFEDFDLERNSPEFFPRATDELSAAPVEVEIPEWIVNAWNYSEYRDTDPEHAYEQLRGSFSGRYGDSSEVDTIVKNVERIDTGTATIDNLIELTEAWLNILPPEAAEDYEALVEGLESMHTFKDLKALGENVTFSVTFSVEEEH